MKRIFFLTIIAIVYTWANAQQQAPADKKEFLEFWVKFKNALRVKNVDFVYGNMLFPFNADGAYFNPAATIEDVKENNQFVFPQYRKEMEFVRFDPILIESENAYIWLGYSFIEKAYFYGYKKQPKLSGEISYEENYWFKNTQDGFKFYKVTVTVA